MMHVKAADKNLDLSCICARDVRRFVRLDAAKLRQVLMNLLGDAFESRDAGGVTLRLDFRARGPIGPDTPAIRGGRTGRGIAPEDQAKIFQPFIQVGKQTAQKGTGPRTRDYKAVRGVHGGRELYRQERAWSGARYLRGGPG